MLYLPLFGLVASLLLLFGWSLRRPRQVKRGADDFEAMDDSGRRHISFLPQIQQTLSSADLEYLASRGSVQLARRVRKERRDAALCYVVALQSEFEGLLRMARVIAALSPEVVAVHELARLRLSIQFTWRCHLLRTLLHFHFAPVPQLSGLSDMVSAFAVRMQQAMNELGERAALAAELASSLERRGVDLG